MTTFWSDRSSLTKNTTIPGHETFVLFVFDILPKSIHLDCGCDEIGLDFGSVTVLFFFFFFYRLVRSCGVERDI